MPNTIFISYAKADGNFALKLSNELRENKVDTWIADINIPPGARWDREVQQALTNCSHAIVILTPLSVDSDNVLDEISLAIDQKKIIIPILYKNCEIPLRLQRIQRIDFSENFNKGLAILLAFLSLEGQNKIPEETTRSYPSLSVKKVIGEDKETLEKLSDIRNVLFSVRNLLVEKANVVATGIGYKTVNGIKTDELSIVCSVTEKLPLNSLMSKDILPSNIQGFSVDVYPTGLIYALQNTKSIFRPAPGGISLGHYKITAGTLGCYVKKNNELYILSNNHVLANTNRGSVGDIILQPSPFDGGNLSENTFARLFEFIPIQFIGAESYCGIAKSISSVLNVLAAILGSGTRLIPQNIIKPENLVDAAIALPINQNEVKNEILNMGHLNGISEGTFGLDIKKMGRTTELTTGIIEQIDVTAYVNYGPNQVALFTDQIIASSIATGGDSGAVILNNSNDIVGLVFAGSSNITVINRIQNVFELLGLALP